MHEVTPTRAAVVRCFGSPEALDRLPAPAPAGAFACRVAEDELLLVAAPAARAETLAEAVAYLEEADPHGLAVDHSDAFAVWTLAGPVREAWARLSENPLPEPEAGGFAFVQGALAHVSGKAIVLPGVVHLLCLGPCSIHPRLRAVGGSDTPALPVVAGRTRPPARGCSAADRSCGQDRARRP